MKISRKIWNGKGNMKSYYFCSSIINYKIVYYQIIYTFEKLYGKFYEEIQKTIFDPLVS
jgi:hypothetical protein